MQAPFLSQISFLFSTEVIHVSEPVKPAAKIKEGFLDLIVFWMDTFKQEMTFLVKKDNNRLARHLFLRQKLYQFWGAAFS